MPPHLKKSKNQAQLENGTYEQLVRHLERELELNGLEAPDELPINNVSHNPQTLMLTDPNRRATTVKNQDITEISVACWKKQREQTQNNQNDPGNKNSDANTSNPNGNVNNPNNTTKTVTKLKESQKLFTHPVRHAEKQTTPQRKAIWEPMQPTDRLPGTKDRKDKIRYHRELSKVTIMKLLKLQPKI